MSNPAPPGKDSPGTPQELKSIREFATEWNNTIQVLASTVISVLGFLVSLLGGSGNNDVIKFAGFALAIVGVILFLVFWRKYIRRSASQTENPVGALPEGSRWRTEPYSATDELPGIGRRAEAKRLATSIQDESFRFGVVTGDTGCGKSSLLASGAKRRLDFAKVRTDLVRSPRALAGRVGLPPSEQAEARKQLDRELEQLRQRAHKLWATEDASTPVLFIDQFEELFIDYPLVENWQRIGQALADLARGDKAVKIVVGVRFDYVGYLHHFAPAIEEPLATRAVTHLLNFTPEEAAAIIEELARDSGTPVEQAFARRLASDLKEKETIRAAELQIVCIAMQGQLTVANYERLDGAKGILKGYIKKALLGCVNEALGQRALRELSGKRAKTPQIKTEVLVNELTPYAGLGGAALIRRTLEHLERSRLLTFDAEAQAYALAADYFVEAVLEATAEVTTRAEEAESKLRSFRQEAAGKFQPRWWLLSDPVIPWAQLRFIKTNASPELLRSEDNRLLLTRATYRHVARGAAVGFLGLCAVFLVATALTFEPSWRVESYGRHWPEGVRGLVFVRPFEVGKERQVMSVSIAPPYGIVPGPPPQSGLGLVGPSQPFMQLSPPALAGQENVELPEAKAYLRLWSVATGERAGGMSGTVLGPWDGKSPLLCYERDKPPRFVLREWNKFDKPPTATTLPVKELFRGRASQAGTQLFYWPDERSIDEHATLKAYNLLDNRQTGEIALSKFDKAQTVDGVLPVGKKRALVRTLQGAGKSVTETLWLWHIQDNEVTKLVDAKGPQTPVAATADGSLAVLVRPEKNAQQSRVLYWPAHKLAFKPNRDVKEEVSFEVSSSAFWMAFTSSGKHLIIQAPAPPGAEPRIEVRTLPHLEINDQLYPGTLTKPIAKSRVFPGQGPNELGWLAWPSGDDTRFWNFEDEPVTISGVNLLQADRSLLIDSHGNQPQVLVTYQVDQGSAFQAWNLRNGTPRNAKKIPLPKAKEVYGAGFTVDGSGFFVRTEGAGLLVYAFDRGDAPVELSGVGGDNHVVSYDPDSSRIVVWTSEGRIIRYRKTWTTWLTRVFGRPPESESGLMSGEHVDDIERQSPPTIGPFAPQAQ